MKFNALLGLLADGDVHSGESLAMTLGVSRTAIWKQIKRAIDEGHIIETIRGKGYRLVSALDLLDSQAILSLLPRGLAPLLDLTVHDELDSTNAELIRRRAGGPVNQLQVCIADCQTAGRGRRGRPWSSPKGENLYVSLELVFHGGFSVLDGLSLVLGLAVAKTLEEQGVSDVGLKWPNDIHLDGKKLAGILVELQGELEEGVVRVVAGIGLNVHMMESKHIDQGWTSLAMAHPDASWMRNKLAAQVIAAVHAAADQFARDGFTAFRSQWQERDVFFNRPLTAREGQLSGIGQGIDESGHYQVAVEGRLEPVRAGELSLRVEL